MADLIELIDIGANLTHDSFDADRAEVISRAASCGVSRLIVTGASLDGSVQAATLATEYPGRLFATAGVHPHHAQAFDEEMASRISALASDAVAVGECGLDYFRNYSPHEAQLEAFEAQLSIAAETGKPVFLHQRDAHDPFTALLRNYLPKIAGGVAHCFTAGKAELTEYLDMGLYIGITGWICDERRGHELRDAVRYLPLDRVLLETDAPYLLPRDLAEKPAGRRNEPSLLPHVLEVAARYMDQPPEKVAEAATHNTEELFRLNVNGTPNCKSGACCSSSVPALTLAGISCILLAIRAVRACLFAICLSGSGIDSLFSKLGPLQIKFLESERPPLHHSRCSGPRSTRPA